jgi:hypothetical protein
VGGEVASWRSSRSISGGAVFDADSARSGDV